MKKVCRTCGLLRPKDLVCMVMNRQKDPDKDFCSMHVQHLEQCEICGGLLLAKDVIILTDPVHQVCSTCYSKLNTCKTCGNANKCSFQTDPSPIPQVVMQTVRQGNMTMQTQIKNPDRIKITCENGCHCYLKDEQVCCREDGCCANYKEELNYIR